MILLQFKDPFDLWKLQGWEIWGGIGEVRVGIGIKTREQRGCHCQLQCCLLLFQTQPGWILLSSLISHYASHVCSLILNTHMNIPPQIQAGLSALEDALKSGYEDFKVTTSSFARLLHELKTNKFQTNDTRLISCSESAPTRISKTWGKQRNSSPCWRTTTSRSSTRTPSTPSSHCSGSASEQLKHGGTSRRHCLSSLVLQFCILQ